MNAKNSVNSRTIVLVSGFLRANGFFDFNVRIDDFIDIILKYLAASFKFGDNLSKIETNLFDNQNVSNIKILNENFIVAVSHNAKKMLRFFHLILFLCFVVICYLLLL